MDLLTLPQPDIKGGIIGLVSFGITLHLCRRPKDNGGENECPVHGSCNQLPKCSRIEEGSELDGTLACTALLQTILPLRGAEDIEED